MKKIKLVMVGNGMAGVRTLEELPKVVPDLYEITVFGAEPHPHYNRILLSPVLALRDNKLMFGESSIGDTGHQGNSKASAMLDTDEGCGGTDQSHQDLRAAIVEQKLLTINGVYQALAWRTPNGCATCRPAVNYCLISRWPKQAQADPQSRFINERSHAYSKALRTVKIAVSGCPRHCAESGIEDVGIIGVDSGGEIHWIHRVGLNYVKKKILDDHEGRQALWARLQFSLEGEPDPWFDFKEAKVDTRQFEPLVI